MSLSDWKGKAKSRQEEGDFTDLNPAITYRHILQRNLGVRDPLRVVALCDSDAFYAACEMVRLGIDKETPLVVLQWDSLIAVNYPARKYGISRMCKKQDALKKCPHLKIVHVATYKEGHKEPGYWDNVDTNTHKVSLDYYRRESMKIAALFRELLPGCEVEKASIDEAFIDFTKPVREILLQRYPYLAQVPADAPHGLDTPLPSPPQILWDASKGGLVPVNPVPESEVACSELPVDESSPTWHDVALSIAGELMMNARQGVLQQLGYSTSAGIARNKFLAKLTASYRKPNGQSILRNAAIPNYLIPMPFQNIRFLGGKLGKAIADEYDAATVGDLLTIKLEEMQSKFGEDCVWVYEFIRGIDKTEVKDKGTTLTKSMLASKNLPKPIQKPSEGYHWIRVLAAELALRLNDAREMSPNLWPRNIALAARNGYESGRSKSAPFPFLKEVTVDTVAAAGDKLWKELVGTTSKMKVTNVSLSFAGIEIAEQGQQSIEGFLQLPGKRPRDASVGPLPDEEHNAPDSSDVSASYTCPRCKKRLRLPLDFPFMDDETEKAAGIASLKMEHDDWHFAQDLSKEDTFQRQTIRPSEPSHANSARKSAKKQKKAPTGIEKFFNRKS